VTDDSYADEAPAGAAAQPATAGSTLRSAREAAGLSVDDVAQQLKLAPRQVQALEDDDYQRLPGRTFARGFARNYARFIQVDPDRILALMPVGEGAPALERPTFAAARRPMGEIPVERTTKRSSAPRMLFLLLALVAAGAAAYYEYVHKGSDARRDAAADSARTTTTVIPAPQSPTASGATTAMPNPVTADSATTAATPSASTSDASPGAAAPPDTAATPAGAGAAPAKASDAALVLTFKGTSWAEVKDANGRVILQMTGGPGMTQTVTGTPPLELSLGNAPEVAVSFRGQSLDLAPFTRGVVARVSLK
jgi:cytoskeleton protein RodZ